MNGHRNATPLYYSLRVFGAIVLVLMIVTILYSGWISISNWTGIGV